MNRVKDVRQLANFLASSQWEEELPAEYNWWIFLSTIATDKEIENVLKWTGSTLAAIDRDGKIAYAEYERELQATI